MFTNISGKLRFKPDDLMPESEEQQCGFSFKVFQALMLVFGGNKLFKLDSFALRIRIKRCAYFALLNEAQRQIHRP